MQILRGAIGREILAIRLDAGDDVADAVQAAVSAGGIESGVFLSGSGTLEQIRLELPANMAWPATPFLAEKSGPAQIVGASGAVVAGNSELTLVTAKRGEVFAGRVLSGNRVAHTAEVMVMVVGGTRWERRPHPELRYPELYAPNPAGTAPATLTLQGRAIDPQAILLVPPNLMRKHGCLPVARSGNLLMVAMTDPNNPFAIDELAEATGLTIRAVGVPARDLLPVLHQALQPR